MAKVLSMEEIDKLLTAINTGDTEPEDFRPAKDCRKIKIYDFKRPDKFTKEHIWAISKIHEHFSGYFTSSLAGLLCSLAHIHVASVDQLTFEEFIRSIPTPTTLGIIKLPPLNGNIVIEIDPFISFAMIDRLMGGIGESTRNQHQLTIIETAIMEEVFTCLLADLQKAWMQVTDLQPELLRIETNPQFAQITHPSEMVVLITLEAKIGDTEGMLNIVFPYETIKSIFDKLIITGSNGKTGQVITKNIELNNREDIPVKLTAEILRRNFTIQEINNWKAGTVLLPLYPKPPNTCFLFFGDKYVWNCEILPEIKSYPRSIKISGFYKSPIGTEGADNMEKVNSAVTGALQAAKINITVELGSTALCVKDVYDISEGSILKLDKYAGEPVDVKANGVLIARAEVVVIDENFGVRIIEILNTSPEQPKSDQES